MSELMSLEAIETQEKAFRNWLQLNRVFETARAAHELTVENEKLREQLRTARADERERAVKILENLNTIIGHPCMIAEAIEEVRALGDTK